MYNLSCSPSTLTGLENQLSHDLVATKSNAIHASIEPSQSQLPHLQAPPSQADIANATANEPDGINAQGLPLVDRHSLTGGATMPSTLAILPVSLTKAAVVATTTLAYTCSIPHRLGDASTARPTNDESYRRNTSTTSVSTNSDSTNASETPRTNNRNSSPSTSTPLSYASMTREFHSPPAMRAKFKSPPRELN